MQPRTVIVCCAALLAAQISQSKIAPVPVNELIRSSDQIVIATVTHVLEDKADSYTVKHATATVRKTLKGRPLQSIRFRVVPANDRFMDSTADAIVGESALLFLYKQDNEEFGLKLAGRGIVESSDAIEMIAGESGNGGKHEADETRWNFREPGALLPRGSRLMGCNHSRFTAV